MLLSRTHATTSSKIINYNIHILQIKALQALSSWFAACWRLLKRTHCRWNAPLAPGLLDDLQAPQAANSPPQISLQFWLPPCLPKGLSLWVMLQLASHLRLLCFTSIPRVLLYWTHDPLPRSLQVLPLQNTHVWTQGPSSHSQHVTQVHHTLHNKDQR